MAEETSKPGVITLNARRVLFAQNVASGMSGKHSAIKAGYSAKNASGQASELMKHPEVIAEIERIQAMGREKAAYTLETAMNEAQHAQRFCESKGQGMALVNATKLRAELAGMLVHRHEVDVNQTVDIGLSISRMEGALNALHGVPPAAIDVTPTPPAQIQGGPAPPPSVPVASKSATKVVKDIF